LSSEEYVYFDAYPGAVVMKDNEVHWKSYVEKSLIETVITKDVLLV